MIIDRPRMLEIVADISHALTRHRDASLDEVLLALIAVAACVIGEGVDPLERDEAISRCTHALQAAVQADQVLRPQ